MGKGVDKKKKKGRSYLLDEEDATMKMKKTTTM
jgi:hypothetical protein